MKYWTCAYCLVLVTVSCECGFWWNPYSLVLYRHRHTRTHTLKHACAHARTPGTYTLAITLLLALAYENKIMRKVHHLWNSVIWEDKIAEYVWTVMISKKGISPVFSKITFFQGSNCANQALFTVEILCPKIQLLLKNWTSKLRC